MSGLLVKGDCMGFRVKGFMVLGLLVKGGFYIGDNIYGEY